MPPKDQLRLLIGSTWNGEPAEESEIGSIALAADLGGYRLLVEAPFHDDPAPAGPPGSTEGLWEYEVLELFVAGPGEHYLEIELGPHGHSLALLFRGVRRRAGPPVELDYWARIEGSRWQGEAFLPEDLLPTSPHRVNAYALHGTLVRRYLAHAPVPGDRADFHQLDRFIPVVLPRLAKKR